MTVVIIIAALIIVAGFAASAYTYNLGGQRTCPRCGSRRSSTYTGVSSTGPIFNCQDCGAVFDGNGTLIDPR
ncbi:MAG TPA: hypothetical protein VMF58_16675 [Rhizomicrobium sp.]|nr:hypothetical protein [Rhizomicrobium sp.]